VLGNRPDGEPVRANIQLFAKVRYTGQDNRVEGSQLRVIDLARVTKSSPRGSPTGRGKKEPKERSHRGRKKKEEPIAASSNNARRGRIDKEEREGKGGEKRESSSLSYPQIGNQFESNTSAHRRGLSDEGSSNKTLSDPAPMIPGRAYLRRFDASLSLPRYLNRFLLSGEAIRDSRSRSPRFRSWMRTKIRSCASDCAT